MTIADFLNIETILILGIAYTCIYTLVASVINIDARGRSLHADEYHYNQAMTFLKLTHDARYRRTHQSLSDHNE